MVSLLKSEKGSLGFTLTKGSDQGCYIHDIVQDPAKADGRLRPGDRMIKVGIHSKGFFKVGLPTIKCAKLVAKYGRLNLSVQSKNQLGFSIHFKLLLFFVLIFYI